MRHTVASAVIKWAGGGRSLVFVSTQREVDDIASYVVPLRLWRCVFFDLTARRRSAMPKTCGLHGGMRQQQRERVLAAFRRGSFQTMVATDVCARGIDITDIKTGAFGAHLHAGCACSHVNARSDSVAAAQCYFEAPDGGGLRASRGPRGARWPDGN